MTRHDPVTETDHGYHWAVMRRAIDLIDARADDPPSLEDLAAEMRMSPAHFQRLFSAWAGVSPKRFQQYLTLGHARALLRERATMLETAHATGLSGTGRLHDLFLSTVGAHRHSGRCWSWPPIAASAGWPSRRKPGATRRWRIWPRAGPRPNTVRTRPWPIWQAASGAAAARRGCT